MQREEHVTHGDPSRVSTDSTRVAPKHDVRDGDMAIQNPQDTRFQKSVAKVQIVSLTSLA